MLNGNFSLINFLLKNVTFIFFLIVFENLLKDLMVDLYGLPGLKAAVKRYKIKNFIIQISRERFPVEYGG